MWNRKRSITLSRACVLVFMAALLAAAAGAPWLVRWFLAVSSPKPERAYAYFLATIYTGCVPAAVLLASLHALLRRIKAGQIFVPGNVGCLRRISWSAIIGGLICFLSGFYYIPWFLVATAAAFMGLIVRVVKNVFAQAVALQDEVDHTI